MTDSVDEILGVPWAKLVKSLKEFNEATCWKLLEAEAAGRKRQAHLLSLYGRANSLRTARQRKQLFGKGTLAGDRP